MVEKYPIHLRALESDLDGLIAIIVKNKNLDELDDHGNSPLHWAVLRGDIEIVEELLKAGANPNICSSDGFTPKWSAVDFGLHDIEELLANYGGKVLTDNKFDKASWSVFKKFLGEAFPKDDKD